MKQNKLSYKIGQFLMFGGPATILFFAVVILPFFYGLYLTFTSWDGVSTTKPFVGLENYKAALADTAYWQSLGRTFIYSVIAVILTNIVAFLLAYLVTSGIKGQNFFRAGFFIPNLIGGIVLGYVWKFTRCFMVYDLNLSLTKGEPFNQSVLAAMHVYNQAFVYKNYGTGQAEALVLFIVCAVIGMLQVYFGKKGEVAA